MRKVGCQRNGSLQPTAKTHHVLREIDQRDDAAGPLDKAGRMVRGFSAAGRRGKGGDAMGLLLTGRAR